MSSTSPSSTPPEAILMRALPSVLHAVAARAALILALLGGLPDALAQTTSAAPDLLPPPPPPPPGVTPRPQGPGALPPLGEPPPPPPGAVPSTPAQVPPAPPNAGAPPRAAPWSPPSSNAQASRSAPASRAAEHAPYPPAWLEEERREAEEEAKPKYKRSSRAQLAVGIVLTSVGPVVMVGGMVVDAGSPDDDPGIAAAVLGGLGTPIGIPLIVNGAQKVPVDSAARAVPAPKLFIGHGSATLRFRF